MENPSGPPWGHNSIDQKRVVKLVSNVLAETAETTGAGAIELERNAENQLLNVPRDNIVAALEAVAKTADDLFEVPRTNYTRMTMIRKPVDYFDEGESKREEVNEATPITLFPLAKFEDWRQAWLRQKTIAIRDLGDRSRETLYKTALAINNAFELTSSPTVTIDLANSTGLENVSARRAVEFLFNRDIIYRYDLADESAVLTIQINVREFLDFRDEIFSYYQDGVKEPPGTIIKSSKSRFISPFRDMDGLRWQEVKIQFVDEETVEVSARHVAVKFTYKEMGLEDGRTRNPSKPDQEWKLLKWLADNHGQLSWDDTSGVFSVKKRKEHLAKKLRSFFGLSEDPFYPYRESRSYRTKLTLQPETRTPFLR